MREKFMGLLLEIRGEEKHSVFLRSCEMQKSS